MIDDADNTSTKPTTGRPPNARGVRILAGRYSLDAVRVLAGVAASEDAPTCDRVRAAEAILEYATRSPATANVSGSDA